MAAVNVVAAYTEKEANRLFASLQLIVLKMIRGGHSPMQPPVNDIDTLWSNQEKYAVSQMLKCSSIHLLVGKPLLKRNRVIFGQNPSGRNHGCLAHI